MTSLEPGGAGGEGGRIRGGRGREKHSGCTCDMGWIDGCVSQKVINNHSYSTCDASIIMFFSHSCSLIKKILLMEKTYINSIKLIVLPNFFP